MPYHEDQQAFDADMTSACNSGIAMSAPACTLHSQPSARTCAVMSLIAKFAANECSQ